MAPGRLAGHHDVERLLRLRLRQWGGVGDLGDQGFEGIAHGAACILIVSDFLEIPIYFSATRAMRERMTIQIHVGM